MTAVDIVLKNVYNESNQIEVEFMFTTLRYFGFYFEIDRKVTSYVKEYKCPNSHQFGTNQGYSFCPLCGERVEEVESQNGWHYLSVLDVEKESGIPEEILLEAGEVSKEYQKYYGLNRRLEGVRADHFDNGQAYMDLSDVDYEKELDNAMDNKEFAHVVRMLEKTYGEDFKIRYGIFTSVI